MKVIITGASGYIGQELVSQCLAHPSITSIVALARRELTVTHEKLQTHVMSDEDFVSYSNPSLVEKLAGANACLYTVGILPSKARNDEPTRRVSIDYVKAAAEASQRISTARKAKDTAADGNRKFRFVYVSAAGTVRDQNASLWYWEHFRKLRGELENILLRHAEANKDVFESYIVRPGLVPTVPGTLRDYFWSLAPSVPKHMLAKAMIDVAIHGNEEAIIENQTMRDWI
ncbi:hypothetical protein BDV18DRAFT_11854 [Aspergillus unguis]